jgi:isoleucyl-tRNA synthetase
MGVDVMRWLYCAHKPENDLLFGYNRGDEVRRQFLIPLWNVYSFLATYANLDGWTPDASQATADRPQGPTPASDNLLDRWVLARLNQVLEQVTRSLKASDPLNATQAVEAFLDDLTNWHVRRSRRRFWKSEHDNDKNTAYATLYHVMVKLALTLAPFTPFVSEAIYQNLVASVNPQSRASVHHCSWPEADQAVIDTSLLVQMSLARQIASLGLSARNGAGLKVRQPLAKVFVYTGNDQILSDELIAIVTDELNVKELEFVQDASQLVNYRILPDNKLLGPRFGAQFPRLRAALASAQPDKVAKAVQAGEVVTLMLDGEPVGLSPQEILVQTEPAEGLAVAADKLVTVAVDATLTPELRAEGLAREVVRRVQAMRKDANFNIEDRITTYYVSEGSFSSVMVDWADYIKTETLSTELKAAQPPQEAYQETHKVDGEELLLGIRRNSR